MTVVVIVIIIVITITNVSIFPLLCRSGMRFSSTECTTTLPRRASLASCQRRTPPTPLDTPDLTGMPQTIQQTAALWFCVNGAWVLSVRF